MISLKAVLCVAGLVFGLGWAASSARAATFTASATNVPVGDTPTAIAAGDLNGDGIPDLATVNAGDQTVTILTNDGAGNFTPTTIGPTGGTPTAVAIGDLNGDGTNDLAVTNGSDNTLTLFLSDGSGGYTQAVLATGTFPTSVAIGDLAHNGLQDLAVANGSDNTMTLFMADGSGGYTTRTLPTGTNPTSVAIGELNGDGTPDLAVTNKGDGTATLFLSDGSGGYTTQTRTTGNAPISVAIGNLNGDGTNDLAVANQGDNTATLFLSDGSGGYTTQTLTTGSLPRSVAIGDLNGDGRPDLAVTNQLDDAVTVFLKDATGSDYTPTTLATDTGPVSLAIADLTGDGKLDIATANVFSADATVLSNTTPAPPSSTALPVISGTPKDGQTLRTTNGTWSSPETLSFGYQWQRCDSAGAGCGPIAGATGKTYRLTSADVGHQITMIVTATDEHGQTGQSTATPVGPVNPPSPPASNKQPLISGTPTDGQTLKTTNGTWTSPDKLSFSYQWQRCDNTGMACGVITGATHSSYRLTSTDVGHQITVLVTAADPESQSGQATATPVGPVGPPPPPANAKLPRISGTPANGHTLTTTAGMWTSPDKLSFGYQWQRCDNTGAGCGEIPGAIGTSYSLTTADVGHQITVIVTATDPENQSSQATPTPVGPVS